MAENFGYDSAYNVGARGATVTAGAASANVSIPNANNGGRARVVRLMVTGNLYVKFGTGGTTTATADDMLLSPNFDVLVNCRQWDTIAYIQETAAAKLNITPLEA